MILFYRTYINTDLVSCADTYRTGEPVETDRFESSTRTSVAVVSSSYLSVPEYAHVIDICTSYIFDGH